MAEKIISVSSLAGKTPQWPYILASSSIVLGLMLIVGFMNIRKLQENYKESFFESSQAVSKGGIQTMEYGLKYGKAMANFYSANTIIGEIRDYISLSENVSIIGKDGSVLFTVFPKKSLAPEEYKALLDQIDQATLAKTSVQTILHEKLYHEFMPVRAADGTTSAYLEITFDDDVLKTKTSSFSQTSGATVLIVTLLATVIFMTILSRVRTTNDKGELRRTLLMNLMIVNITICQLIFIGITLNTYRNIVERNAVENTRFVGKLIKQNIDAVIAKGVTFDDLDQTQTWMSSVLSSAADIKGAVVSVNDGKVSFATRSGLSTGSTEMASEVVLPLKSDRANNQATLTMVLDRDGLRKKLVPTLVTSLIILVGSIVVLVQITFIMIFIINRRAMSNLKQYNEQLEQIVAERTHEIQIEKEKSDKLLLNILPPKVAEDLKEHGASEPQAFENVSVFFSDVVGFTTLSSGLEAKYLIKELSDIFTNFDRIIDLYHCQRIKTIGDAYLCVSGMPEPDAQHAHNLVNAALDILGYLEHRNRSSTIQWNIRVGIHSGPVVAGIVGTKKYLYDVFGDTINTASRMESNSEPKRINISDSTMNLVKDDYHLTARGDFEVKGKGVMHMYFVDGRR